MIGRNVKRAIGTLSAILLMAQFMTAQDFFKNISQHTWIGTGELLGSTASFQMNWVPILDGQFYKLSFQHQRDESEELIFKSMGVYQPKNDGTFSGTWFDSRGLTFPLKGNFSGNTLTVLWGTRETEEGKTVYTFTEIGTVTVTDYVLKDGEFVKFGNANYVSDN